MATHMCLDCDSPGDGSCPVCHGIGMLPGDSVSESFDGPGSRVPCTSCNGSGECRKCDGNGQVEVGGES